jgi:hypothetical protein
MHCSLEKGIVYVQRRRDRVDLSTTFYNAKEFSARPYSYNERYSFTLRWIDCPVIREGTNFL